MNGVELLTKNAGSESETESPAEPLDLQEVVADRISEKMLMVNDHVWTLTDLGDVLIDVLETIGFDWNHELRHEQVKAHLAETYRTALQIIPERLREF